MAALEPDGEPATAAAVVAPPVPAPAVGAATSTGMLPERAAAERLLMEGRVKPANDFLRAMLARGDGGPG